MKQKPVTETRAGETKGKKETVYYFALNVFTKALTYFLLLAFANLFSLVDYGQASFAIMVYTIAAAFVFPGFTTIFVPAYIKKDDVSSLFFFSGLAAFAFAAGTLLVSLKYALVWPLALCFIFGWIAGPARAIMRAEHKYHFLQATEILFISSNLLLVVYWRGLGDVGIIYAMTVATFLTALASVWISRRGLARIIARPRIDLSVVKTYWLKGLSLLVLLLSFDVLGRSDSVVLGLLSSFENVARYNIASAIAGILTVISMAASMFLLTRSAELGEKKSEGVFLRSVRIAFSFNLLAAIALMALIHPLMRVFFNQYVGNEFFVMVLTASTLFYSLYLLYVTQLAAQLKPEKALKSIVVAAGVNLALDFALIPFLGLLGICIATIVAGITAFSLIKIDLPAKAKALVYLSPLVVAASYYLGVIGLALVLPAIALLLWTKSFEEGDWLVIKNVLKQVMRF